MFVLFISLWTLLYYYVLNLDKVFIHKLQIKPSKINVILVKLLFRKKCYSKLSPP